MVRTVATQSSTHRDRDRPSRYLPRASLRRPPQCVDARTDRHRARRRSALRRALDKMNVRGSYRTTRVLEPQLQLSVPLFRTFFSFILLPCCPGPDPSPCGVQGQFWRGRRLEPALRTCSASRASSECLRAPPTEIKMNTSLRWTQIANRPNWRPCKEVLPFLLHVL